ncbi:MAG TPA: DUF2254 domain-containing protein [Bacillales bacterium]
MKRTKIALKIRESFWFLPLVYSILALIIAFITVNLDFSFTKDQLESAFPDILVTKSKLAVTILSTLTTSILTLTTITFSSILVVLTTFSGQFSPRTLQDFISDRITQHLLAIFVSGFIYNLVTLLLMGGAEKKGLVISPVIGVLSGMLCAAGFVYLIHHVAASVQVNQLINRITKETLTAIGRVYNEQNRFAAEKETETDNRDTFTVRAKKAGYIELLDIQGLIELASRNNATVQLHIHIGDYVLNDAELLTYRSEMKLPESSENQFRQAIKLGPERTSVQDIEFGIQKLVEIALRAISPAINDPHTAINCINRIGTILRQLEKQPRQSSNLYDNEGHLRLIIKQRDLEHYLYKSFYQIRHYAKEDISVTVGILQALKLITEKASPSTQETVLDFAEYVMDGFDQEVLEEKDQKYLQRAWRDLRK